MKPHPLDQEIERGIRFLANKDKRLAAVIKQVGKLNYRSQQTAFDALSRIIIGQQLSGKAADTIYRRVRAITPNKRVTIKSISAVKDVDLRSCGLSAAKTRAIRDLIDKISTGQLKIRSFFRMTDEEVAEAIIQVKGLGPWSAQMYLMFVLCRLDIFSAGDLGIQNAICKLYGKDKAKTDFDKFAERWKPYRTIACWYLWASLDNRPIKNK